MASIEKSKPYTHLVYKLSHIDDAINRFSPAGYEMIGDDLLEYLLLAQPIMEDKAPVVLEITGSDLDETQQKRVARALRSHFRLCAAEAHQAMARCRAKTIWFALSFLLSSLLLFAAGNMLSEVATQFFYLPFWFFGYRVLTFPIFEYLPARKEHQRFARMAAMELIFTHEPLSAISPDQERRCLERIAQREGSLNSGAHTAEEYFMEGDWVVLECNVRGMDDLVRPSSTPGHELPTAEIISYLEKAEPFVGKGNSVELSIGGCTFAPEEQSTIKASLRNYYNLQAANESNEIRANLVKVLIFALCLIVSGVVLSLWGGDVSVATHELMLIALWFFGDYLIEFALLEHVSLTKQKKRWKTIASMDIIALKSEPLESIK